jgi:hypothetical protein
MNSPGNIPHGNGSGSSASAEAALREVDATLRLLAKLPAPAGLADRVFAGVLASPRKARVLEWPRPLYARDWVRSLAAAVIVMAVAGGGWGIYAHVQRNPPARVVVAPRTIFPQGGFSSAEMIRRPQTLNGPVVKKAEPAAGAKSGKADLTTASHTARPAVAHRPSALKVQPDQTVSRVPR